MQIDPPGEELIRFKFENIPQVHPSQADVPELHRNRLGEYIKGWHLSTGSISN